MDRLGRRKNFFSAAGVTQYQLPAPPGHWLPNAYCEVLREPCGTGDDEASEACRHHRSLECATETLRVPNDQPPHQLTIQALPFNQPPYYCGRQAFVQPCDWESRPELLGSSTFLLPLLPIDDDFPYACAPGLVGSVDESGQKSALCAGRCPAGKRCPEPSTVIPLPCTAGAYCPEGSTVPVGCPAGRWGQALDLEVTPADRTWSLTGLRLPPLARG